MKPTQFRDKIRHVAFRDKLRSNVEDEHFLQIFSDFATLVRTAVKLCERNDDDYPEVEVKYIEELLGLSFVLLQANIRRISEAAAKVAPLLKPCDARALGAPYKDTGKSLTELIWALANYYKHCDEWTKKTWGDKKAGEKEEKRLRNSRNTRRIIEKVGIRRRSTDNMRTAYYFFEIDWASDCRPLAGKVQEWANAVYKKCAKP